MLINKQVLLGGVRGTIISFTNVRFGCMQMEDGSVRRCSVDNTIKAFFDALRARGGNWPHEDLKLIIVALLEQLRKRKTHEVDLNKRKKKIKQRRQELSTKLKAVEEQQREAGSQRENLETSNPGLVHKFLAKLKVTDQECERLQTESQTIENEASRSFKSRDEIVQFFSDQGVPGVSYRSLSRWSNGDCMGQPGRMTVFDEEAETLLVQTILRLDEAGVPMGESEICSLAHSLALEGRTRFGQFGPTRKWYHAFVRRAKARDPQVTLALARGTDCKLLRWFNSKNVKWWHGAYVRKILKYGFA